MTGSTDKHLRYRSEVCSYMVDHQSDFAPFLDEKIVFDRYGKLPQTHRQTVLVVDCNLLLDDTYLSTLPDFLGDSRILAARIWGQNCNYWFPNVLQWLIRPIFLSLAQIWQNPGCRGGVQNPSCRGGRAQVLSYHFSKFRRKLDLRYFQPRRLTSMLVHELTQRFIGSR